MWKPRSPRLARPSQGEQSRALKWLRWRKNGAAVIEYLLDSQVHTYAFSVAANAIISFIPFIVLLYTISREFFHSEAMVEVIGKMVHFFLPSNQDWVAASLEAASARHGVQVLSLVMILISCTGIFLPLEVALNQTCGVTKHRNYLMNQLVAFGLALLMVALGILSILLSAGQTNRSGHPVLPSHAEHHLRRDQFRVAASAERGGIDSLLLLDLLVVAQPAYSAEARDEDVSDHRRDLAGGKACLRCGAAVAESEGSLWAVLCVGRVAVLGLLLQG